MFFIERFEEKKNENYSFMFNSYHKLAISQTPPHILFFRVGFEHIAPID